MFAMIDRHFAGRISVADERAMRDHVASCEACRGRYRRHLVVEALDPDALGTQRRLAVGLGLRPRRRARWLVPAVLAFAAWALVVGGRGGSHHDMTARGGGRDDVVGFRVRDGAVLAGAISRDDELSFAYRATGAHGFLAVFAIDVAGRVYWYYPAWTDAGTAPAAVAIHASPDLVELPEAIRHDLHAGALWIYAAFLDRPWTTVEIEARVVAPGVPVVLDGVVAPQYRLEVRP
jgi:hypothetical protein